MCRHVQDQDGNDLGPFGLQELVYGHIASPVKTAIAFLCYRLLVENGLQGQQWLKALLLKQAQQMTLAFLDLIF